VDGKGEAGRIEPPELLFAFRSKSVEVRGQAATMLLLKVIERVGVNGVIVEGVLKKFRNFSVKSEISIF
jgi:hypothetical protein